MYKIVSKEVLNQAVELMVIHAPYVARKCEAGQFIIIRVDEEGERVPLTIADYDREAETVTIIYQVVGYSTELLSKKQAGDYVVDFVGPLGQPAPLHKVDHVVGVAGGVGSAPLYPQLRKLHEMGVKVDVIIGGRSAEFVILKEKFAEFCDHVYIATDDGSLGTKGFVTDVLKEADYTYFYTCGPMPMFKAIEGAAKTSGQYSFEERMGCGFGACMGCTCKTKYGNKRICKDGPVLEREEIVW